MWGSVKLSWIWVLFTSINLSEWTVNFFLLLFYCTLFFIFKFLFNFEFEVGFRFSVEFLWGFGLFGFDLCGIVLVVIFRCCLVAEKMEGKGKWFGVFWFVLFMVNMGNFRVSCSNGRVCGLGFGFLLFSSVFAATKQGVCGVGVFIIWVV